MKRLGNFAPLLTLIALIVFYSFMSEGFWSLSTVQTILSHYSIVAVMAVGITFVLLIGEIDLSIANMATFAGVLGAYVYVRTTSEAAAIAAGLLASAALGLVSGLGTARFGIPSFMMTLSMLLITEGLTLKLSSGRVFSDVPNLLVALGSKTISIYKHTAPNGKLIAQMSLPISAIIALCLLLLGFLVLRYTRFGRFVYMVGGNRRAAELAGVNVRRVVTACLCICGFTAGFSGLLLAGRLESAQPRMADSFLLECISAVVLGGTSLFGGKGGIVNTVIGVLTLGVLNTGLLRMDIDIYIKQTIGGLFLLGALLLNVVMSNMKSR